MLRDPAEAEDVAQETFMRLWKAGLDGHPPAAMATWIYRTSTRIAIDRLRHRKVVRAFEPLPSGPAPGPDARVQAMELLERVARSVDERALSAALLHRIDGLEQAEIAEVLQVSTRTVRRLLERFDESVAPLTEVP